MKCSVCGTEMGEGNIYCYKCGKKADENQIAELKKKEAENKGDRECAKCGEKNEYGSEFCKKCGWDLGKGFKKFSNGKEIEVFTCAECGKVYELKPNVVGAVIMFVIAALILLFIPILAIIPGYFGYKKLKGYDSICPECNTKYADVIKRKKEAAMVKKAKEEMEKSKSSPAAGKFVNTMVCGAAWMNRYKIKMIVFQIMSAVAAVMHFAAWFISGDLENELGVFEKEMLYADAVWNFAQSTMFILIVAVLAHAATMVLTSISNLRNNGWHLISGVVAGIFDIVLFIVNVTKLAGFEYDDIDFQYNTAWVNVLLIFAAIIVLVSVIGSFISEKGNNYILAKKSY